MFNQISFKLALAAVAATAGLEAQNGGMQQIAIMDPVLGMRAWALDVPAGWRADGAMFPGTSCAGQTTPVYRAFAPDGLTGVYMLPPLTWAWGDHVRPGPDCLPLQQVISAKDFATYMTRVLGVGIIRENPPSANEIEQSRRAVEAKNQQSRIQHVSTDFYRYRVGYSVNNQPMEESLEVNVLCIDTMVMAVGLQHSCSASVFRFFAPAKKLDAALPVFRSCKLTLDQQWWARWQWAMADRLRRLSQAQTQAMLDQGRLAGEARMREHQAFMVSFQQGADARNQRFEEGKYRKQQMSENFIDHVTDCQRAYGTNVRVSAPNCQARQTW